MTDELKRYIDLPTDEGVVVSVGIRMTNELKRYTDLPALLYMLKNKCLTMLDPATWDDKNDIYYLKEYKDANSFKTVLVLCFTEAHETYHHWRVFAGGTSGVRITFKKDELLEHLKKLEGIVHGRVEYTVLKEIRKKQLQVKDFPFKKRYGFLDEQEYRLVYTNKKKAISLKNIPIPISCIKRVTLSPWIARPLSNSLKRTIRTIEGCEDIKITRSTLIDNTEWKNQTIDATKKT